MALIRYAEGQQRSGSMGATVYSHNRFGAYIRARSIPVNPNTDRQISIRNKLRALSINWENVLTPAQREAWEEYGDNVTWKNKLGDAVNLTGLNHYIRSNVNRLTILGVRVDVAPGIFNLAVAEQSLGCSASEATQNLTFTFDDTALWTAETGGFEVLFMGLPQNANIKFFGGPYRYVGGLLGQDAPNGEPASPYDRPVAWPIVEGQRIWVRTRIARADGRLSEFAEVNFLVGA